MCNVYAHIYFGRHINATISVSTRLWKVLSSHPNYFTTVEGAPGTDVSISEKC
jgi:hypothetical protein